MEGPVEDMDAVIGQVHSSVDIDEFAWMLLRFTSRTPDYLESTQFEYPEAWNCGGLNADCLSTDGFNTVPSDVNSYVPEQTEDSSLYGTTTHGWISPFDQAEHAQNCDYVNNIQYSYSVPTYDNRTPTPHQDVELEYTRTRQISEPSKNVKKRKARRPPPPKFTPEWYKYRQSNNLSVQAFRQRKKQQEMQHKQTEKATEALWREVMLLRATKNEQGDQIAYLQAELNDLKSSSYAY